jgi:hypothetical protein
MFDYKELALYVCIGAILSWIAYDFINFKKQDRYDEDDYD